MTRGEAELSEERTGERACSRANTQVDCVNLCKYCPLFTRGATVFVPPPWRDPRGSKRTTPVSIVPLLEAALHYL